MKLRSLTCLAVFVLLAMVLPRGLSAEEPRQLELGIAPLEHSGQYFDVTMFAGETRVLKVELGNHGTAPITARTYAADAYSLINGGFGARLDGEPRSGATLWIGYPSLITNLPGGGALQRSFTVSVPVDAAPGEYITSLVVQNAEPVASEAGSIALLKVQRKAIAVAITVSESGSRATQPAGAPSDSVAGRPFVRKPTLLIGRAEHKYVAASSVVAIELANEGNVHLRPSGSLLLYDSQGQQVSHFDVVLDAIYAGTTTKLELPFTRALLAGQYGVSLRLDYDGGMVEASQVPLEIPQPTKAEAGGAPTGAEGRAQANQLDPSAFQSAPSGARALALAIGALALIAAIRLARKLWRRRALRSATRGW